MTGAAVSSGRTKGSDAVFASFQLAGGEFAVDVRHVQEVVRRPADILPLPLLPDYALGVFNLRGTIVPLLCTRQLLGGARVGAPAPDAKVAIVHHRGVRLGLACDDTSRMLRPRSDQYAPVRYTDGSTQTVASGMLKLEDGMVPVIDLDRLLSLRDIPFGDTEARDVASRRALRARKRCISFRVGQTWMALPISEFREILKADGLEAVPLADPVTRGVLRRRGQMVPVVHLARILGAHPEQDADGMFAGDLSAEARVIVLAIGTQLIGFLVDAVEAIETYHDDEMMPVPVLSARRGQVYAGSVELGGHGLVFLLSRDGLSKDPEVQRIATQYETLFAAESAAVNADATASRTALRATYLWFRAQTDFALPMSEIRELVEIREPLVPLPGTPAYVRGMLNLRGRIVTVVDARSFFDLPDRGEERRTDHKILVLERDETLVGFSVDSVESILHIAAAQRFDIPAMLRAQLPAVLRDDMREMVRISRADGQTVDLLVLNASRLLDLVQLSRVAA